MSYTIHCIQTGQENSFENTHLYTEIQSHSFYHAKKNHSPKYKLSNISFTIIAYHDLIVYLYMPTHNVANGHKIISKYSINYYIHNIVMLINRH